ncbi:MAG: DUF2065 domain-containing protein [Pseudomonadota bacterium]
MQWSDLWAAFAIYLVLEGLAPFASPTAWREAVAMLASKSDVWLRRAGFISMAVGVGLLYVVRASS